MFATTMRSEDYFVEQGIASRCLQTHLFQTVKQSLEILFLNLWTVQINRITLWW